MHLKQVQQICLKRQIKCICIFKIVVLGYVTIVLFQKINELPNSKQWYQLTTHRTFFIFFLFGWSDGVLLKEVASHLFPLCPMTDQSWQSDLCSWTYLWCKGSWAPDDIMEGTIIKVLWTLRNIEKQQEHIGSKRILKNKLVRGFWIIGFGFFVRQVFTDAWTQHWVKGWRDVKVEKSRSALAGLTVRPARWDLHCRTKRQYKANEWLDIRCWQRWEEREITQCWKSRRAYRRL